ncbi:hypothetical protein F7725_016677 [Dissostichus mawsoni]|uniref:Uncharacterized protein n=1 Tax=Dissostichus mawsoni TaxID=36200 RepID=A0A7J5Z2D7_DISMA|nr:hypothetical protein F7725_016677 [Dissostichus mawsoni]
MYGVSGAQQQGFQVFRGSTFSISCSIQPQYPGGSFLLSSSTHNYTQPAATRGQRRQEDMELQEVNLAVPAEEE